MAYNGGHTFVGAHPSSNNAQRGAPPPPQNSHAAQPLQPPTHFLENGRYYGNNKPGHYLLPIDEEELDRMDIFHHLFKVARKDSILELHQRPLPPGAKILDLGCGTGIWAIDMAEQYHAQHCTVIGWDLNNTQPKNIPINTRFHQFDFTEPVWPAQYGAQLDSFDLISMRMLAGSVGDWPSLYQNIYRHLKPGAGVVEHVELDFRPISADNPNVANSALGRWAQELQIAYEQVGKPWVLHPSPDVMLKELGFQDVEHRLKEMPYHPWPEDSHLKDVGTWFNLGMTCGIEAFSLAPLTRIRGYPLEQAMELIRAVRQEIATRSNRVACTLHIWTARRGR